MSIFDEVSGVAYDAEGKVIEKPAETVTSTVVETPAVITQTEVPVTGQEAVTVTSTPEINWESVLAEKTGGKVKSWEEIESRLSAEPQAPLTFANDDSKRVFEYLTQGKVEDVLQVYNEQRRLADLDKISDADAVKLLMEYKNPNFTAEDINDEVSTRYQAEKPEMPVEDDYIDEDAYRAAQKQYDKDLSKYEKEQKKLERQLKLDANTAREQLAGYKKDIILPDINPVYAPAQEDEAAMQQQMEEHRKAREAYLGSLKKSASEFKEIPFEFNDEGVNFKGSFQIEDAERAQLENDLTNKNVIDDILLPRYDKGGVYDTRQLMEDVYFLNNKDKIIQAAVKQAIAQTSLDNLKRLKNIDLDQSQRGVVTEVSDEVKRREFAKAFMAD
jgi:predicted transposase YbfD/YdcC